MPSTPATTRHSGTSRPTEHADIVAHFRVLTSKSSKSSKMNYQLVTLTFCFHLLLYFSIHVRHDKLNLEARSRHECIGQSLVVETMHPMCTV